MKHLIKLMLLAALAFPTWPNAAAQTKVEAPDKPVVAELTRPKEQIKALESCSHEMHSTKQEAATANASANSNPNGRPQKAPERESENLYIGENATGSNNYVPVYGYYYESTNKGTTQIIYPSSMLADFVNKPIKAIRFFCADDNGLSFYGGQITATLGISSSNQSYFGNNATTMGFNSGYVTATTVPERYSSYLTFTFDQPFVYTSGNLLIQLKITTAGTYGETNFVGTKYTSGNTYYSYSQRGDRQRFMPKTMFFIQDGNSISTEDIDFGTVTCGTPSSELEVKTVTITNNNSAAYPITWKIGGANAEKFSTTPSVTTVPANGTVTFPITFNPGQATGSMYGRLDVEMNNTKFRVALRGKGVKNYDASVSPTSLDFGEVLVNENGTATVTLTNTGLQAITPVTTSASNAVFSVSSTESGNLAVGDTRVYTVLFAPTAEEAYTASFNIKDDAHNVDVKVNVRGKGVTTLAPYVAELSGNSGNAGSTSEVYEGAQDSNSYTPFYGYYFDYGTGTQMIYPAGQLGLNVGDEITSITFYTYNDATIAAKLTNSTITMSIGETDATQVTTQTEANATALSDMNANRDNVQLTQVFEGKLTQGVSEVTFTFSQPYTYHGGNLFIDNVVAAGGSGNYSNLSWKAVSTSPTTGVACCYYNGYSSSASTASPQSFLPKMTLGVTRMQQTAAEYVPVEEVAWGNKDAGSFYSKDVTIYNPNKGQGQTQVTMTTDGPFYFAQNTSSNSSTAAINKDGTANVTLYFNPTAAAGYTGHLTITADGHTSSTRLTGVGLKDGEIATRDSAFFASLPKYEWTDSEGKTHESKYTEIATDPNQIIALIKEVYTNPKIPGNWKRGFDENGNDEDGNDVSYSGVGTITHNTGSSYSGATNYSFEDTYGWDIPATKWYNKYGTFNNSYYYYTYMDPTEYKPEYEGLTLLLVEMSDDYSSNSYYDDNGGFKSFGTNAENLRYYIQNTIKSVRVVTNAKRTGTETDKSIGTLFKIDCDKMNKFFLMAKGQVRNPVNSCYWWPYTGYESYRFCPEPAYMYCNYSSSFEEGWQDNDTNYPFWHMFEQFSPVTTSSSNGLDDLYRNMTEQMESFGVIHDCASIALVGSNGHQFMMYGDDDDATDCADVRDMVFFVPDYRMMKDSGRDPASYWQYINYNTDHQPQLGIYVIHQDEIEDESVVKVANKQLYQITLKWKSNMDDFLPRDEQEYQLYQMVTNDFGDVTYEPVYYRDANGNYLDGENGNIVSKENAAPVVLSLAALNSATARQTYSKVYIDQESGGKTVTFAIKGQDADHFLDLQMSNEESCFIPGYDATEMMHTTGATYYSRFEPQGVRNCYSNKIEVKTNPNSIPSENFFYDGSEFKINRTWYEKVDDETTVTHTTQVAVAKVTDSKNYITVYMDPNTQSSEDLFPKGESETDGRGAGYHANPETNKTQITYPQYGGNYYASFSFELWDNFVVDVSKNDHPGQYVYEVVFNNPGDANYAHSNKFNVPVYKTDSRISAPHTLAEVLDDNEIDPALAPGEVAFDAKVKLNSKSSLLRYDAYRWDEGETRYIIDAAGANDEEEEDLPPTGIAGNQGEYYSLTMNKVGTDDYYVGENVSVNTADNTNWASFVDYYATNEDNGAGAYVYAPVVELYTRGYATITDDDGNKIKRGDYNTYGGPLQNTAVGKLKVTPYYPTEETDGGTTRALMSDYKWQDEYGDWCSYYNIFLNFEALDVPEGYELYKVRAWRKVDQSILDEPIESRYQARIEGIDANGWYLYEDMNFGDPIKSDGTMTMSCSNLKLNPLVAEGDNPKGLFLGERSVSIAKPQNPDATDAPVALFDVDTNNQNQVDGEMRATFGAVRLKTSENDKFGSLDLLEAKFKVRAYFTRKSNPLIAGKSGHDPIYVVGDNGSGWDYSTALATLYTNDGTTYSGNITVPEVGDSGLGYFSFATSLPASGDNRFGAEADGNFNVNEEHYGQAQNLKYWSNQSRAFAIPAGTYNLSVNLIPRTSSVDNNAGTVTITKGALRAPRREAQMTGSDFDYYVAESDEITFRQEGGSGVITGISAVKQDVNREVVGVSYVNTIGQVSSTPWQGVNMVVTRYSDGSTTTKKVIK